MDKEEVIRKIGREKFIRNCEALAGCLESVGNIAVANIEQGKMEPHPMLQIRKAIDDLEQEHVRQTGKTFLQYAEANIDKLRKQKAEEVEH